MTDEALFRDLLFHETMRGGSVNIGRETWMPGGRWVPMPPGTCELRLNVGGTLASGIRHDVRVRCEESRLGACLEAILHTIQNQYAGIEDDAGGRFLAKYYEEFNMKFPIK